MPFVRHPALTAARTGNDPEEIPAGRRRALLELFAAYATILLALWTSDAIQKLFIAMAVLWVVTCAASSWRNLRESGLSTAGFRQSTWVVVAALLVALGFLLVASRLHTLHIVVRRRPPVISITAYAGWALLQEFILVNVFLSRMLRVVERNSAAVIATAVLFAMAHIPNPLLVAVTLFWGAIACVLFLRYRNLYTLAIAHAVVGLTLAITVPDAVQHQMRVGIGYLHWHAPADPSLSKPQ